MNPTEETVLKIPNNGAIEVSDSPQKGNETNGGAACLESLIITPAGSTSRVGGCPKIDREQGGFSGGFGAQRKKSSENGVDTNDNGFFSLRPAQTETPNLGNLDNN